MSHQLPSPADVVRSSADTVRRIAASFRRLGDARYAEHLDQRATRSEERALYLDALAQSRSARQQQPHHTIDGPSAPLERRGRSSLSTTVRTLGGSMSDDNTPWTPRIGQRVRVKESGYLGRIEEIEGTGEYQHFILRIAPVHGTRVRITYRLEELEQPL